MRRVCLESPFAGNVAENIAYAKAAVRDCLGRREAPIASHLLFTQDGILRDDTPAERELGINAGLAWQTAADAVVVYTDCGISPGMELAIDRAKFYNIPIEYRSLPQPQKGGR
jgi:hypothetical protein